MKQRDPGARETERNPVGERKKKKKRGKEGKIETDNTSSSR